MRSAHVVNDELKYKKKGIRIDIQPVMKKKLYR